MKKLFISCPIEGRTRENIEKSIEKMHKIAEIVFDQPLKVIHSHDPKFVCETVKGKIFFLGKVICMMSEADYFIGISCDWEWSRCYIEHEVAKKYGIPSVFLNEFELMPDLQEVMENRRKLCETINMKLIPNR